MNGRKVFADIKAEGFDCALFLDETSQYYLSDFPTTDGVVIVSEKETALITDSRYIEAVENDKKAGKLTEDVMPYLFKKNLYEVIAEYFASVGAKRVCLDPGLISVKQLQLLEKYCEGVEFGYLSDVCLKHRKIKTEAEVAKIKKAQSITDAAFSHILGFIAKGKTELEVAAELEYFMRSHGADGLAFETIAVSGKNSSLPHGIPTEAKLTENSFFTMDYGARFAGYCSDMTRTVVLGKADDEMKRIYNTVLTAQTEAIKFIKAGVTGIEADKVARDIITDAGYGECFGHSLGHSLGLEIHELPSLSVKGEEKLVPGHIVTVEPGIYIPGKYGVRIENMVLVTENGCENLTNSNNSLIEL
ncbi:MAG: aminopeptidase P family protein [Clostridia bacterium]|nr:aminopeptidase P family protein [Clostridia bacterium]